MPGVKSTAKKVSRWIKDHVTGGSHTGGGKWYRRQAQRSPQR
jgi:hypothetical protein